MTGGSIVKNTLVPFVVVKSRTQDECYVTLIPSTEMIALLPRADAQKKYMVGDSGFALVKKVEGWRNILTQKDPEYITLILNGIFSLEKKLYAVRTVKVSGSEFYKVAVAPKTPDIPHEMVVYESLKQCHEFIHHHISDRVTFVSYDKDPEKFIISSLAPGKADSVRRVILWKDERKAMVIVDPHQKPVFLGPRGLNVASASKLTDWHIDIQ